MFERIQYFAQQSNGSEIHPEPGMSPFLATHLARNREVCLRYRGGKSGRIGIARDEKGDETLMIETTPTIAKKFWLISLQACLIVIFLSLVEVPAVFATTMPPASGSPNVPPTNYCLHGAAGIIEIGSNEIRIMGGTANYCGDAYTLTYVNQRMALTNGCEGTLSIGTDIIYEGRIS